MERLPLLKHPGIVLITLLVSALLVWGFWPRAVVVEAVAVKRAPLTVTVEEEGRTRVIDRYVVSAPVDGVACRVQLDVGDRVTQGQVLLSIAPLESRVLDPRSRAEAEARVAASESALEAARQKAQAAQATAAFYTAEVNRLRPLADKGVISREAMDKAEMEVLTAKAALRSATHAVDVSGYELEAARTALHYSAATDTGDPAERVLVRSPVTGSVLKIPRECEGPVRTGDPLLEIADPAQLEVEVDVLSSDAVKIKPGTQVLFDRWGGDDPLQGVVRIVEPVGFTKISALGVEEQRVLVIAEFVSPPALWQRLGDGYRVEARFVLWHDDDVLQVPASSLFRVSDGWAVFVVENGRARRREVSVGRRTGLAAQILDGVTLGEVVIIHPSDEVEEGRRVMQR